MFDSTSEPATGARADGGRSVLRYGAPAEAIGRPSQVFGRFNGEFVLIPQELLERDYLQRNESEPGVIQIGKVPESTLDQLESRLTTVEISRLASSLAANSSLDEQGARVLLLFEGFEFEPDEIAAELGIEQETVIQHVQEIYDRYDEDDIVAQVQAEHPEVPDPVVRTFVLATGFGWDNEEIAADLGVDENTTIEHLVTARQDHEELGATLEQVIQSAD